MKVAPKSSLRPFLHRAVQLKIFSSVVLYNIFHSYLKS